MSARVAALTAVLVTAGILIAASQRLVASPAVAAPAGVRISGPVPDGHVVWYTSLPQTHADRLANAFQDRTGLGVDVVRASAFVVRTRVMDELAAGKCGADVLTISDLGTYADLEARGELAPLASLPAAHIPARFRPSERWVGFSGFAVCMAYDESRLDDPPEHWTDLLASRWRERLGLENIATAGSQYGQYYLLRELLGLEFWGHVLREQRPRIADSTDDLADALLTGEIDIAAEFSSYTAYSYQHKKGTPLRPVYPTEGVPYVLTPTAIPTRAAHPDEARALTAFLLSREGQELMQRLTFRYAVRDDVAPLAGMPALESLTLLLPDSAEDYADAREAYVSEFGLLVNGGRP